MVGKLRLCVSLALCNGYFSLYDAINVHLVALSPSTRKTDKMTVVSRI